MYVTVVVIVLMTALGVYVGRQGRSTSTTTSSSTSSTSTTVVTQPSTAVWPFATSPQRFGDPETAAFSFATAYLGFVDPIMGAFQQGDTRSGEVPIRSSARGPVTTVLVRQLTSDNTWWILGSSTPSINITHPAAHSTITSPVSLRGTSTAFEANVNVDIREDATLTPLLSTTVMGGSMGVMGPFAKTVTFATPTQSAGAIVMRTFSAKDGSVIEASVIRVFFTK
jgi:hypothetical protein